MVPPSRCIWQVSNEYLETCRTNAWKSKRSKTSKNNRQNSEYKIFEKAELMSRSLQRAPHVHNLKDLSWFMKPWLQKMSLTYFWLLSRSTWPDCDETQTRHVVPPTECIYQVSNWCLKACWTKSGKQTDGWTDGHFHGIIRPFFKRAYKNHCYSNAVL